MILKIVLISILHKMKELNNIQGSFACRGDVNVLMYNMIHVFLTVFHIGKKRGLGVFLPTVCFKRR